jgi:putative restriction endonuclease
MTVETDEGLDWLTAMRLQLERYRKQHDATTVTLDELYDFCESRLSNQFPEKDHVRAKIRQLLQRLRNRDEVEFLDDSGTYRIKEIQLEGSTDTSWPVETGNSEPVEVQTPGLYFSPVSDYWRDNFRNSVEEPIDLTQYEEVPPQLEGSGTLRIWATTATESPKKQAAVEQMRSGDLILFYHDGEFFAGGRVRRAFENPDVGELIWGNRNSRHIYIIDDFTRDVPDVDRMWELVGYEGRKVVQDFTRVADDRVSRKEYNWIESALSVGDGVEPSDGEIEQKKSELEQAIESELELTEDEQHYVQTRRKARDSAFTELVRDAYENTCAVCESQRESPDGNPEVEAAHIYPLSEGGRNDVRNGVALCKLHHWAFDSGWLSLTDDHEIIVAEAPDKNGYYQLKQLEGQSLHLPDNEAAHPHPMFLEQHRRIHDFE